MLCVPRSWLFRLFTWLFHDPSPHPPNNPLWIRIQKQHYSLSCPETASATSCDGRKTHATSCLFPQTHSEIVFFPSWAFCWTSKAWREELGRSHSKNETRSRLVPPYPRFCSLVFSFLYTICQMRTVTLRWKAFFKNKMTKLHYFLSLGWTGARR